MDNVKKITESELNKIVRKVIKEQQRKTPPRGAVMTTPAKEFIQGLYDIADKYGKVDIKLSFDGKYITGMETNTRQKFTITIT